MSNIFSRAINHKSSCIKQEEGDCLPIISLSYITWDPSVNLCKVSNMEIVLKIAFLKRLSGPQCFEFRPWIVVTTFYRPRVAVAGLDLTLSLSELLTETQMSHF